MRKGSGSPFRYWALPTLGFACLIACSATRSAETGSVAGGATSSAGSAGATGGAGGRSSAAGGANGDNAGATSVSGAGSFSSNGGGGDSPSATSTGGAGATSSGGSSASSGAPNAGNAGNAGSAGSAGSGGAAASTQFDVTFFVVADTHADPMPSDDLQPTARALNAVAQSGVWPAQIDGQDTHFKGGPVGKPRGVVFLGDLTGWGTAPTELLTFRHYFEAGNSGDSISYPAFLGLGNHDVDTADRTDQLATQYRAQEWGYVNSRHLGASAPVPVTSFDAQSHAYSFDFAGVHLIQGHRFIGDKGYGLSSGLSFVADDLKKYASDGRPVFLFQHYGMDAFGTEARWWTDDDRAAYRATLHGYHVSAVMVGHSHAAFDYSWEGLRVFQVNNAKAENGTGNNDGNGSFAIVRVTKDQLDIVTCRWLDANGKYELIGPFSSGPTDVGAM